MTREDWGALQWLRRGLVAGRDWIDGLLHPARRRRAQRALADVGPVRSVVFVCLGNVCRSPYAAASLQRMLPDGPLAIDSKGFIGPGRPPPSEALVAALELGVDHSAHRSMVSERDELATASIVFVFDDDNVRRVRALGLPDAVPVLRLGDFDPIWEGKRPIWDPWGRPPEDFLTVFRRIDRCLAEVVARIDGRAKPDPGAVG